MANFGGEKGNFSEGFDIDLTIKGRLLNQIIVNEIFWGIDELNAAYTVDLSVYNNITSQDLIEHIDIGKSIFQKKTYSGKER